MNEREKQRLFDLLADDALVRLSNEERAELNRLKKQFPEWENDFSHELAASAINLSDLKTGEEALPANLRAKILSAADDYFSRAAEENAARKSAITVDAPRLADGETRMVSPHVESAKTSPFSFGKWLGWGAAVAACAAVAIVLWLTYSRPPVSEAGNPKTVQTPEPSRTVETGKTPEAAPTAETAGVPEPSKIPANAANNETPKTPEIARKPESNANRETAKKPEPDKTPESFRTPNAAKTPDIAAVPARTPELSSEQKRAQLLASAPDVVQTSWTSKKDDKTISGDVVWSSAQQKGYIRLRGMPALDPNQETYQLWIVDETQKKTPISAGIFNVGRAGEIIVPINAQSKIIKPKSFAITKEKAGGVTVSDPSRVVAVAKI